MKSYTIVQPYHSNTIILSIFKQSLTTLPKIYFSAVKSIFILTCIKDVHKWKALSQWSYLQYKVRNGVFLMFQCHLQLLSEWSSP